MAVVRIIRKALRHGEIFIFAPELAADDVGVFIHAAVPGAGIEYPVTTHPGVFFKHGDLQACSQAVLGSGDAAGASADHADFDRRGVVCAIEGVRT